MSRAFKVPILLPADPTNLLEAVTKQYVDARVVTSPAEANARSDSPTAARFGHNGAGMDDVGYMAAASGSMDLIVRYGTSIALWERSQDQTTHRNLANFFWSLAHNAAYVVVGDTAMGGSMHPGYVGIWKNGAGTGGYTLIIDNSRNCILNGEGSVSLRIANQERLTLDANTYYFRPGGNLTLTLETQKIKCEKQIELLCPPPGNNWSGSQLVINDQSGQCRLAMNTPGVAPMIRILASEGENMICVNNPNTAYASFGGAAYIVKSSADVKEAIRPLRRQRERIVVKHEPLEDKVEDVDIMGLRPVIYRPKVGATRVLEDGTGAEWEPDTVFGKQGKRERLGLIADEVQHVLPTAVFHDIDGNPWGIYYEQIVVALLDHVQRLTETVETLRYRVAELEKDDTCKCEPSR